MQHRIIKNKITFSLVLMAFLIFACDNNKQKDRDSTLAGEEDTIEEVLAGKQYTGDFIYTPEAAVLTGKSFIYGVEMNELALALAEKVELIKNDMHDNVTVTVLGEVSPKPEGQDGWDEIITITHIIDVGDTPTRPDVQF